MEVKVLQRDGHSALVEWFDGEEVRRGVVPVGKVEGKYVNREELDRAIPYGEPWEELVELKASSVDLARNLRNVGIWTLDDLRREPDKALSAIIATYGVDYQILLKMSYQRSKR